MKWNKIIWYLIKMLVFWMLGFLYFIIAALARVFDLWQAQKIFNNYLNLFHKGFGLNVQFQFEQKDIPSSKNTVFVLLNQSSMLDSLIIPPINRIKGIINFEFGLYPIVGWFMAITNFVIIRQFSNHAKRILNKTNRFLQSGGNIYISIEGKRTRNGLLSEYKKGPVVMAINNQSDIVPMIIKGAYEALPYRSFYIKPGDINVKFLKPISTSGMTYENRNELKNRLLNIARANGLK